MTLADARAKMRSDAPTVLIKAAAGCGKTHEASALAHELAQNMEDGQEVLVLTHTNAAVLEFNARTGGARGKVRASTIDSFCLDVVAPYADALGLPFPLRRHLGSRKAGVDFSDLAPKTDELLQRAPSVAHMLAVRHPAIILDEHQDAAPAQHAMTRQIVRFPGVRMRVFTDPMQAIFENADQPVVSWDDLVAEADQEAKLEEPQRWTDNPELGRWIQTARENLENGRPIPFGEAPGSVRLRRIPDMPCAGNRTGDVRYISAPLHLFLDAHPTSCAVLLARRNAVRGYYTAGQRRLFFNEGMEFTKAYDAIDDAISAAGNPLRMARAVIRLVERTAGAGLTAVRKRTLKNALIKTGVEPGRNREMRSFMDLFRPLYAAPDVAAFCRVVGSIPTSRQAWLKIREPETFWLLGRLRPEDGMDPRDCLAQAVMARKSFPQTARVSVGTIHKAKGHQFDHVLIGNFSADHFPDTENGRKLAYVALSRAVKSIQVIVPNQSPSPLIGH